MVRSIKKLGKLPYKIMIAFWCAGVIGVVVWPENTGWMALGLIATSFLTLIYAIIDVSISDKGPKKKEITEDSFPIVKNLMQELNQLFEPEADIWYLSIKDDMGYKDVSIMRKYVTMARVLVSKDTHNPEEYFLIQLICKNLIDGYTYPHSKNPFSIKRKALYLGDKRLMGVQNPKDYPGISDKVIEDLLGVGPRSSHMEEYIKEAINSQ